MSDVVGVGGIREHEGGLESRSVGEAMPGGAVVEVVVISQEKRGKFEEGVARA